MSMSVKAAQPAEGSTVRSAIQAGSAAIVIGTMAAAFALSFAAIVYSGPLAPHLSQGIALTLLGAIVMAVVAPFMLSYRGTLVQPQDVTAILLALGAASIAARPGMSIDAAFATTVVFVGATAIVAGAVVYAVGALKLGNLARFVPFPVVAGFLAASGALLIRGAFDMVAPAMPFTDSRFMGILDRWPLWLPWLALGAAMVVATRRSSHGFAIPSALALGLAGFYTFAWVWGLDHASMRGLGLLLGPFEGASFFATLDPAMLRGVDWPALLVQAPVMGVIIGITLLGTLLNASGLEIAIDGDIDFERDLKGVGLTNIAAGLTGGLVGYHTLGETLLARRVGVVGVAASMGAAVGAAVVLFFGAELLSGVPIGLLAAVIFYLGIDLILTSIWEQGRRMPPVDLAIVLLTPLIALLFGFMAAVAFGVVTAALVFIFAYSAVDLARLGTTGANFHARVERSPADQARLTEIGGCVQIHQLEGYVFFGSASKLVERLQRQFGQTPRPRFAIIDFRRVVGVDVSAWAAFERLARGCRQQGTELFLTGLSPKLRERFGRFDRAGSTSFGLDLDEVLAEIEERLLGEADAPADSALDEPDREFALPDELAALLRKYGYWMNLAPGDTLMAQGARSDHLVFLVAGRCRASIEDRNGERRVVSRFLPGAMLGEIAYYAGVPRTASIVSETAATAVRIDADALARMEREDPAVAASFHRMLAVVLARRLMTTSRLLNDAEL
jgi:SulP family sulfate permease